MRDERAVNGKKVSKETSNIKIINGHTVYEHIETKIKISRFLPHEEWEHKVK